MVQRKSETADPAAAGDEPAAATVRPPRKFTSGSKLLPQSLRFPDRVELTRGDTAKNEDDGVRRRARRQLLPELVHRFEREAKACTDANDGLAVRRRTAL